MILQIAISRLYSEIKTSLESRWSEVYAKDDQPFEGYFSKEAEKKLKTITGRKHAFIVTSGTAGIHVMLLAQGIKPGDEVICVNHSAPATAMAIASLGAQPVFVDLDNYGSMDCDQVEQAITSKTKAILATGLYGDSHDHDRIKDLGVPILNDSCQSFCASYKGTECTKLGDMSIISFSSNKICPVFGTYGAVMTDNDHLAEKISLVRRNGYAHRDVPNGIRYLGINAQPCENKCVEVLCSLEMLPQWQSRRRNIAEIYDAEFKNKVATRFQPKYSVSNNHKYTLMIPNKSLAHEKFKQSGIETRMHYTYDFSEVEVFGKKQNRKFPMTYKFIDKALTIPINPWLKESEQEYIIEKTLEICHD